MKMIKLQLNAKKIEKKGVAEVEWKTQGSRPRTRMLETKDTSASALQNKKKVFTKFFHAISSKITSSKNFLGPAQNFNNSKIVLSSSRGQANFRGLEASRPRIDLRGQGLDLQGQGLQNVSSRTPPLRRTSVSLKVNYDQLWIVYNIGLEIWKLKSICNVV